MRGRRPKPTKLKVLQGNPGKRALPKNEPEPPPGEVAPPVTMKPRAREVWDEFAPIVEAMGLLTTADTAAFAILCELILESYLRPRSMPASRIARMESLFGRFGMDPASRARLGSTPKPKANPFVEATA